MSSVSFLNLLLHKDSLKPAKKHRNRPLSMSEIITITVNFPPSGHRSFTHFNLFYLYMKAYFSNTVSYNRFTELMKANMQPPVIFMKTCCLGEGMGSTHVRVCKNKRINFNQVFEGIATTGNSTSGWFHGFKLNIIVNYKGKFNFLNYPMKCV